MKTPTLAELQAQLAQFESQSQALQLALGQLAIGVAGYGTMSSELEAMLKDMHAQLAACEVEATHIKAKIAQLQTMANHS